MLFIKYNRIYHVFKNWSLSAAEVGHRAVGDVGGLAAVQR